MSQLLPLTIALAWLLGMVAMMAAPAMMRWFRRRAATSDDGDDAGRLRSGGARQLADVRRAEGGR